MKRLSLAFCCIGLITLGITSCTNSESDEWRDNNLNFFYSLKNYSDLKQIGDSINGYPGLFYKVYETGTGKKPIIGDYVDVMYSGWLWNDTISYNSVLDKDDAFDYTTKAVTYKVGKSSLIDGFNIALQSMTVGSRWRIFVPYYLAYGSSGTTGIDPYSTLIFDIRLVSIED
jgi:FKBP-type peptidyl-prolyl cis-trans isomerase